MSDISRRHLFACAAGVAIGAALPVAPVMAETFAEMMKVAAMPLRPRMPSDYAEMTAAIRQTARTLMVQIPKIYDTERLNRA